MKQALRKIGTPLLALACVGTLFGGIYTRRSFASEGDFSCSVQTEGEKFADDTYLPYYKVPTDLFTYTCNGGSTESSPIENAFDGNFSTFWESARQNTRTDTGEGGDFTNEVQVTFKTPVEIGSVLYQCSPNRSGTHGYPQELEIFITENNEEKSLGVCSSTPVSSRVLFDIGTHTVTGLRFSFKQPNKAHNWVATAREIVFLQPENTLLDKVADGLFGDYAETEVGDGVTEETVGQMRVELASRASFSSEIEPSLDRAQSILDGTFRKEEEREFSTAAGTLTQYGNIRSYCGNVLKMSNFGIDYQPTGIAAPAGEEIVVYVEAGEHDPLPSLVFTQTFGDWRSWLSRVSLHRGKNVLTVPDFIAANPDAYTVPVQEKGVENGKTVYTDVRPLDAGGAIYLENPYTPEEQERANVYLEGGVFYPLFREGGDANAFRTAITEYREKMEAEPDRYPDVAEIASDHVLASSLTGPAYELFVTGDNDPETSCTEWDGFIEGLLGYGGVSMQETDPYYQEINLHLRHNLRLAQPWAGALAYAAGGFCGFCSGNYDDGFALLNYHQYGWAMPHELGHSFDNNMGDKGRTTAEVTNNMWAIWNRIALEQNPEERYNAEQFRSELSPDAEPSVTPYEFHRGTGYVMWWQIETRYPGFWGNMENYYRYHSVEGDFAAAGVTEEEGKTLTQEERHVYLCSLAAKTDLGYFFDRWGFFFATETVGEGENAKIVGKTPFDLETCSPAYRKLMAWAGGQGNLPLPQLKLWYSDYWNYTYVAAGKGGMYSATGKTYVKKLYRTEDGYALLLPEQTSEAHLGYEILEGGEVIGFTGGCTFTDSRSLPEGYLPSYTVRAYDRLLNCTSESAAVRPAPTSDVCRVGERRFSSLADGIAAAGDGETVSLLVPEVCLGAVSVEKTLTLCSEWEGGTVLLRVGSGEALITVKNGGSLTLSGEGNPLILDGANSVQKGAFVQVESGASLLCEGNVTFRNCISSADGGGIASGGTLTLNGTLFEGNTARKGGAIHIFPASAKSNLAGCVFRGNAATANGGAVYNIGTIVMEGCTFTGNSAQNGGAFANDSGGVATVKNCNMLRNTASSEGGALYLDGNTTFEGGEVAGNTAMLGGGLSARVGNVRRNVTVNGTKFKSNRGEKGGALYLNTGVESMGLAVHSASFVANEGEGSVLYVQQGLASLPKEVVETEDFSGGVWKINGTEEWKQNIGTGEYADLEGEASFYVRYADGREEKHARGDEIVLPAGSDLDDRTAFDGWLVNGTLRREGEKLTVEEDTVIEGAYTRMVRFTFSEGAAEPSGAREGEVLALPAAEEREGKRFVGWEADGTVYGSGAIVYAERDMTFTAVYEDLPAETPDDAPSPIPLIVGIALGATALVVIAAVLFASRRPKRK